MTLRLSLVSLLGASMFSGALHAQADWTQLTPSQLPPKRGDHVLVADNVSLWCFGGRPQAGNFVANDTWRYLGNTWVQQNPSASPSGRWHARAAFDSGRNRVVLFGGRAPNNVFYNDTWEIVGTNWVQNNTATKPPVRERCGMAYDAKRGETIVFGGRTTGNANLGDMWSYDGTNWTQLTPTPMPSARWHPQMAYDPVREVIVLFGGNTTSSAGTALRDTWEWDGVKWSLRTPAVSPPGTYVANMIYDEARERMVLFGGVDPQFTYLDTTWEYDGTTWEQRKPKTSPGKRGGGPIAYVPSQRKLYLFAGFDPTIKQLQDFWEYSTSAPAAWTSSGAGCAGAAGTPKLSLVSSSWGGSSFAVQASPVAATTPSVMILGFSKTAWGAIPLPLSLTGAGANGCSLYTDLTLLLPAVNGGGGVTASLPLPNDVALAGLDFYQQMMLIEPASNALGLVFSDLGEAKLGLR